MWSLLSRCGTKGGRWWRLWKKWGKNSQTKLAHTYPHKHTHTQGSDCITEPGKKWYQVSDKCEISNTPRVALLGWFSSISTKGGYFMQVKFQSLLYLSLFTNRQAHTYIHTQHTCIHTVQTYSQIRSYSTSFHHYSQPKFFSTSVQTSTNQLTPPFILEVSPVHLLKSPAPSLAL